MGVYVDLMILLNFLVDFLLILGTNRLSGYAPGVKRAAAGAVLGAVYAAGSVIPGFDFLGNTFWRLVSLALISIVAFGRSSGALRRGVLFVFLSMALGGIALGMGNGGFWAIVMGALGIAIACVVGFCGRPGQQKYVPVSITHGDRQIHLTALMDTGNTLKDPISGTPVLVADSSAAEKLLGLTARQLASPIETMESKANCGLRLIPYHAIGQPGAMLLGLRAERLQIDGKTMDMIVAFAPQRIGQGKPYQALTGGYAT